MNKISGYDSETFPYVLISLRHGMWIVNTRALLLSKYTLEEVPKLTLSEEGSTLLPH